MDSKPNAIRDFVHDQIRQAAEMNRQPIPHIDDNFNLVESDLFDSVQFVGLLLAIEQEFNCTIDPAELGSGDLVILGNLLQAVGRSTGKPLDMESGGQ